jgi:hypothetical protein
LIQAFHEAGVIHENAFSLCMSKKGGALGIGGTTEEYHLERMKFSKMSRHEGYYALYVAEVKLGTICIACGNNSTASVKAFDTGKGTILDSGTTDTYLPKQIAPQFQQAWKELTGIDYERRKYSYSYAEFQALPNLHITFQGDVHLTIDPEKYMEHVPAQRPWTGRKDLINRIYVDEPEGAVLGGNALFGYDILYHIGKDRIGLAKADCDAMVGHRSGSTIE